MKMISHLTPVDRIFVDMFHSQSSKGDFFSSLVHAYRQYKSSLKGKRLILFESKYLALINASAYSGNFSRYRDFIELMRYYEYFIYCIDDDGIKQIFSVDSDNSWAHSLTYYFRHYVVNRKKPWSRRDVINEVFVEQCFNSRKWKVNETRNMERF